EYYCWLHYSGTGLF
nr:immunoglobulin light chain junction region [Macaca mulatta]